jgi:hypothetical protein
LLQSVRPATHLCNDPIPISCRSVAAQLPQQDGGVTVPQREVQVPLLGVSLGEMAGVTAAGSSVRLNSLYTTRVVAVKPAAINNAESALASMDTLSVVQNG